MEFTAKLNEKFIQILRNRWKHCYNLFKETPQGYQEELIKSIQERLQKRRLVVIPLKELRRLQEIAEKVHGEP